MVQVGGDYGRLHKVTNVYVEQCTMLIHKAPRAIYQNEVLQLKCLCTFALSSLTKVDGVIW